MMRRKGQVHILRKITVSNSSLASWYLSPWKCYASMVYPCTNPVRLSGLSLAVEHLQYILWNMYIFSVEQQQNIRVTLIIHFSHPNKASLTRHVPHHIYPAGSTSLSIPPFLSFLFISLSLYLPVTLALPLSPLFLFPFYFFCSTQGAAPGEHYFQKASSCIIVRIHALISWTIWQTAYAPSSLNALHLLIKWMSHCFQSNTLNLWASLYFGLLSQTRLFMLQRLYWSFE